ncbi:methionine-synthesizing 5- methyltetrahydropteroyltriglutamate--homocysteine methyltransferase [Blyttiomyces sp. JEL0837]|nr:methionine-synthesizing 5- methyltetrahydropteroyltriglutamate--homocysteine methyltransferase [Blyttiomyces sp. JEL0837]
MVLSSILGFPRFGANRELKHLVESFWAGKISESELLAGSKNIRESHWVLQKAQGLDQIPSNDFSLYDHVLDAAVTYGAIPPRYQGLKGLNVPLANNHLTDNKPVAHFLEARAVGIETRPVLIGPVSFLALSRVSREAPKGFDKWTLLPSLVNVFAELIVQLANAGASWIQIDEPHLVLDLTPELQNAYKEAYTQLNNTLNRLLSGRTRPTLLVATYFEALRENTDLAVSLPGINAIHIDLVRTVLEVEPVKYATDVITAASKNPNFKAVSVGVVDGRNIWKTDLDRAVGWVESIVKFTKDHRLDSKIEIIVASSCSLLHSPHSVEAEKKAGKDLELVDWLAFAVEKVKELSVIGKAVNAGRAAVQVELAENKKSIENRRNSKRINNAAVQARVKSITPAMSSRKSPYPARRKVQQQALNLPKFPTTTIGSFPQTAQLRRYRAQYKAGTLTTEAYEQLLREEVLEVVKIQEELDIDVLVHGEPERNDMVEYFGEQLDGVGFSVHGWVQSYGSRAVKPPIIYGDVSRPHAMTTKWTTFAQSLTARPMKAMLTGPITILCWSFVRDDQPREITAKQLALAVRDEVHDLEKASVPAPPAGVNITSPRNKIQVIQIDEPAIREGLPLRRSRWDEYLRWATEAFKISSTGVEDATQIHSHMCYSDFEDIMDAIVSLDCDVLSIESAKSDLKLLTAFQSRDYPNELGPGLYDIHTPRVPPAEEMAGRVEQMLTCLSADRIWINPDCGLKTRQWPETKAALVEMVKVAKTFRAKAL